MLRPDFYCFSFLKEIKDAKKATGFQQPVAFYNIIYAMLRKAEAANILLRFNGFFVLPINKIKFFIIMRPPYHKNLNTSRYSILT